MVKQAISRFKKVQHFMREELWLVDLKSQSFPKRCGVNLLKVIYISARGFISDNCALHASALTFITLLSVIPVMALAVSVADMLGQADRLIQILNEYTNQVPPDVRSWITRLLDMVQQTNFVKLGIVGFVFLGWTYVRAMSKIEVVFNMIWGVRNKRRIYHKISLYLVIMILVTLVLVASTFLNAALKSQELFHINHDAFRFLLQCLSGLAMVCGLSALLKLVPFTKVSWRAAFLGGLFAGVSWFCWQRICIAFQIGINDRYGAIYGAFASIPVTLYWMYVNWILVLIASELTFAVQNFRTFSLELEAEHVSQALRRRLAFRVVYAICKSYKMGQTHWNRNDFQTRHKIPIRLLNDVLEVLKEGNLIIDLADGDCWVPAKDVHELNMRDIEFALRGKVHGKFAHVGKLPVEMAMILKNHEASYFDDLSKRSFADLIDHEEDPSKTNLMMI